MLRAALVVCLLSACVTTGTYDKKVAELEALRAQHDKESAKHDKLKAALEAQLQDAQTSRLRSRRAVTRSATACRSSSTTRTALAAASSRSASRSSDRTSTS